MEVFLLKVDGVWKGQRFGPYSPDQVKKSFASGDFTQLDLAFFDGCDGWVPITQVPGVSLEDDERSDDPEVDLERQRELAEMFPDPEDDIFDEEDEETETAPESPPPPDSSPPDSSPPDSSPPDSPPPPVESAPPVQEPQSQPKPTQTASPKKPSPSSSKKTKQSKAEGGDDRGRRISLSKAQTAIRRRGGDRRRKRRGVIPLPPRPGTAAFGWMIFLSLLYGIGVAMMPDAGVKRSSPVFAQTFGQLHPILVHLPVGALLLAFPMHLCDRPGVYRHVGIGSVFVLWFAVLGSTLAVFTGYFQSFGGVSDAESLAGHVTTGILIGAGTCGALFLKLFSRRFGEAWLHHLCSAVLFATALALLYNVHLGASLTHGKDYLGIEGGSKSVGEPSQPEKPSKEEQKKPGGDSKNPEVKDESPF